MSEETTEQAVLIERRGRVMVITLNRPDALNALSMALRNAIADTFDELEADPEVQVIILTGHGTEQTVHEGMQSGAVAYLSKPCDFEELVDLIEKVRSRDGI
mgnify:CR=1 FL=1